MVGMLVAAARNSCLSAGVVLLNLCSFPEDCGVWGEMQDMEGCPAQPKEAVDARESMGDCPLLGTPWKRKGYKADQPCRQSP